MSRTHPLGSIAHLWRYPIKSLAAERLAHCDVGADGIAGDRSSALIVATAAAPRAGKPYRGKENARLHTAASEPAANALARDAGLTLERRDDGPFFDLDPISILFDTWLVELEALVGIALDPLRFRPNIVVRAEPGFAFREADLAGRTIRIGDVRLGITEPIRRCVTPTYDIATGAAEPRILTELVRHRKNEMGIYARVLTPGPVATGNVLELESD